MFKTTYLPGNYPYTFASDFATDSVIQPSYSKQQLTTLQQNGKDEKYAGQYCEALIFGNGPIEIDGKLTNHSTWYGVDASDNATVYLSDPAVFGYAASTIFVGGEEFGQDETSNTPAKIMIDYENHNTLIKWYYNGSLLHTDTIASQHVTEFAIAVKNEYNNITDYAFIYYQQPTGGNLISIWGSGSRGNPDVLSMILNRSGVSVSNNPVMGWADPDDPNNPDRNFVLSTIEDYRGNFYVTNWDDTTAETDYAELNGTLQNKADSNGDIIGTDVICWLAETNDISEAWAKFNNDPEFDGIEFEIPYSDDVYLSYALVWNQSTHLFSVKYTTPDEVEHVETLQTQYQSAARTAPAHVYLTAYYDSFSSHTILGLVTGRLIAQNRPAYYIWRLNGNTDIDDLNYDEFDYAHIEREEYNGYGGQEGNEDNPQTEPDDIEEPDIDALATGFIYAFAVNQTDMQSLVESLNGATLSAKIKADFGNHLFDFIVSYHTMPCITNADFNARVGIEYMGVPFTYGPNDTPLTLAQITKSFYSVNLGSQLCLPKDRRTVNGYGFEDWSNAQVQVYLPFIGYQHLNTADVWGKYVHIVYYFDVLAGTCTANIGIDGKGTLYTFESSCSYKIPFTSAIDTSLQQMMSGVMSAGSALIGTVANAATGNIGGAVASAMGGAGAIGNFVAASQHKAIINRGGQLGGAAGWHTPRNPALIITVPDIENVTNSNYLKINGYPTFKTGTLSSYAGNYVEISQIDLKAIANGYGALPNDDEMDMIKSALKEGVFV